MGGKAISREDLVMLTNMERYSQGSYERVQTRASALWALSYLDLRDEGQI